MTVEELMEELKTCNTHAEVRIDPENTGETRITEVCWDIVHGIVYLF